MKFDENLKDVLIDKHVTELQNMELDEEEKAAKAKVIKQGIAIAVESQKLENEKRKIDFEEQKFKDQIKLDKKKFEFDKTKFEYRQEKDKQDREDRIKEYELKKDQLAFEYHKFEKEFELRREDSKRGFKLGIITAVIGGVTRLIGIGSCGLLAHREYKMSRVMEYKDACRETETMRESNKIIKDLMRKNI